MPQNAKTALNIRTVKFTLLLNVEKRKWKILVRRVGEGIHELNYY